jgi:hypothetical protein
MFRKLASAGALFLILLIPIMVLAGERTLSINRNDQNAVWFITGEPSMILNGFDLTAFGVAQPAVIDRVSIAVDRPVPDQLIDVVIYQDANGGSPVDATVAGRTTVDITQSGVFTVTFPQPVTVTAPAVWVGFYLPVDFRFLADSSGPSVLTYWAWNPAGRFDPGNLASAAVLGPADGNAPVNINMNGIARITLEITSGTTPAGGTPVATVVGQFPGTETPNFAVMVLYPFCQAVSFDTADEVITYRDSINLICDEVNTWESPANPRGFVRRGPLYDIQVYTQYSILSQRLPTAVTHCIRPAPEDVGTAIIGNAFGAPRAWRLLPTARYGDVVCAEVFHGGNLSYFVPAT